MSLLHVLRTPVIAVGTMFSLLVLNSTPAASDVYSIDAHIFSAGSSTQSGNSCFRMQATLAEPVAGYSASTDYVLVAGFLAATQKGTSDGIFFSGFEDCTP
jgi:hypothetical protein